MSIAVEMKGIHKYFPGVHALKGVQLTLNEGEVMALLGENGAGKSTLMKILSGIHQKDEGSIRVFGKEITSLTPKEAQDLGIAIIHQELNMCQHLTVAQNIFLGREITKHGINAQGEMNKMANDILSKLRVDVDAEDYVGDLSVSKQQMVEIAKALSMNAKVLIMDEPTSALSVKEIEELFRIINELKAEGTAIVYISHRLEELKHIVDRVTIMRDGTYITTSLLEDMDIEVIIENMVGREIEEKFPRVVTPLGETVLKVESLNAGPLVRDISFELKQGEIVGIAGLVGAGRTEMTRALFGIEAKDSGRILLNGTEISIESPAESIAHGIVLAPEDRKHDGLCTKLSIRENIALSNLDMISNALGVINQKKEQTMIEDAVNNLHIKLSSPEANADSLSGGNQQKVVVAKWLARTSNVVIFDEPTRGIDVAAKVEIYNLMNELKQNGVAVLFASSEMPEVMGISDRILVMCDGKLTASLDTAATNQNEIMKYATQFENKHEVRE
ncbi:sugar ABC transporter ATP-binding protein [Erysipelothrix sp. HDW6C]|uniref:sugar ABC transporter ATP-binding protein n=1 Tax=Erysipelothrix sp. HDW6C TaxID=2714930 RepID=UPI00140CEB75|nr:sugar ABC transporter ATP-binding protein [Erysipelothrix sp. HDW6C]QIK70654.1 sugar ABC transporter ATP-binding protein [Erysipelothrix sp. HDW6C]